jgi:hypothetical protein
MYILTRTITILVLALCVSSCTTNKLEKVDFLVGTWKIEGKEVYESWKVDKASLKGISYRLKEGKKHTSETLEIKGENDQIIYIATVANQNEGKGIPFVLQPVKDNKYSFENKAHDFPKKIQYTIVSKKILQVSVLGENDKGFSYKMIKQ